MQPINWHSVFFLLFSLLACVFALAVVFSSNIVRMAFYLVLSLGATAGLVFSGRGRFRRLDAVVDLCRRHAGAVGLRRDADGARAVRVDEDRAAAIGFWRRWSAVRCWPCWCRRRSRFGDWQNQPSASRRGSQAAAINRHVGRKPAADGHATGPRACWARASIASIGRKRRSTATMAGYLLPFEIVSVHLLVVLIGAAYLARTKRRASRGPCGVERRSRLAAGFERATPEAAANSAMNVIGI